MNNNDEKPKEGQIPEDEEAHRNLVGFFRLLWEIDNRLKRKESSQSKPMSKKKPSSPPPGPKSVPPVSEKRPPAQATRGATNIDGDFASINSQSTRKLSLTITIRLDPETVNRLRALAQAKGIGPTTLIRMWVIERIRETSFNPKEELEFRG